MVIAVTLLSALSLYLLIALSYTHNKLKETIQFANKLNTQLDHIRTIVIKHDEVATKLTDAVEYLIVRDGAPYVYMGEKGDA